jgi:hypothetical protein
MARSIETIMNRVETLRQANADRDKRFNDVHDVRSGDIQNVIPGSLPDAWPKPIVANLIDTSARDTAEVMGVMPSINCSTGILTTDKAKKFSSKKTKVANYYVQCSHLNAGKQISFADFYNSYGLAVYVVEPDFENKRPHIRVENPMGLYIEKDVFGRVISYTKVYNEKAITLENKFPKLSRVLRGEGTGPRADLSWGQRDIEVVKYCDADSLVLSLPQRGNAICMSEPNPMGTVYVSPAFRPGFDTQTRGSYDDAIWVQLAKARMALLGLEPTEKTVRAPLAVPRDLQNFTFGDDAVLRTDNPDKIRRVGIDVPQASFQEQAMLEQELRTGTRTPEARSGNIDASIITGKGVQALMGSFNTVITTGQTVIQEAMKKAIELCFEMDEKLWPNEKKTVRGTVQGTPFEESYVPAKDIDGDYTVDVTYGFAAGQDPARAIVGLLQLRGDQLISRDFFQRQLPMNIDVVQMQTQIDNEQFTDALKQGIMGYAQTVPQMALQGMDPTEALERMAKLIQLREKGDSVHDAVVKIFKPKEAPAGSQMAQDPMAALMGQGAPGGAPGGLQAPSEGAQGFDLQSLLSGLTSSGEATASVRTQRQSPV